MNDATSLGSRFSEFPRSPARAARLPDLRGFRARVTEIEGGTEVAARRAFVLLRRAAHDIDAAGGVLRLPLALAGTRTVGWAESGILAPAPEPIAISFRARSEAESGAAAVVLADEGSARLRVELTLRGGAGDLLRPLLDQLGGWWAAHRDAGGAPAQPPGGRRDQWLTDTARRLWPGATPPAALEELTFVLDQYRHAILASPTHFYVGSTPERDDAGGGWRLRVRVESPSFAGGIRRFLAALQVEPRRVRFELLPEAAAPGTPSRFGLVTIDQTLLIEDPDAVESAQTEVRRGEPVWVLDSTPSAVLVHSSDGYWGWAPRAAIEWVDAPAFGAALQAWGRLAGDHAAACAPHAALRERIVAAAAAVAGLPYVWGGRGECGLDCSGFVQTAYAAAGIQLPRDAWQQALAGRLVATRWARDWIRPLDLLFFAGRIGRVTHVALALGGGEYVHLAPPEAQVSSLRPGEMHYIDDLAEQLVLAKRILG